MITEQEKQQAREAILRTKQPQKQESSWQDFDSALIKQQAEQRLTQNAVKQKDGFFTSLAKDVIKPFAEVGTAAYNVAESTGKMLTGDTAGAAKSIGASRELPFLGQTKPAFTGLETTGEAAKKMGGYGAEIGSWFVGGGGAKNVLQQTLKGQVVKGLAEGAKVGALSGALAGGGRAAEQEGTTAGDIAAGTAIGGTAGLALGSLAGTAGPIVAKGAQKVFQPIESKVSETIREAVDKGIKPYFKGVRTPEMARQYYQKAEDAFKIIKSYSPEIFDEEKGLKIVKNPTNRKEMLEALNETKKKIYEAYNTISREAGEEGASYNPRNIMGQLLKIADPQNKRYTPDIRNYANNLLEEVGELTGQTPEVIEARIADLNQSLAGYFDGRVTKAKAQIDASVANMMRKELDELIARTTGEAYQPLKNAYGALKTVEEDLARQVAVEARRNQKSLLDFTDIFTGGDLFTGLITANPAVLIRGAAARGIKEWIKYLNDPNVFIKKAFDILDKSSKFSAGSNIASRANETLSKYAGLSTYDVTKSLASDDIRLMEKFIDDVRIGNKVKEARLTESEWGAVEHLANKLGISLEGGHIKAANKFEDILSGKVKSPVSTNRTGREFKSDVEKGLVGKSNLSSPSLGQTEETKLYHATPEKFEDFDLNKTEGGVVWFTDNPKEIKNNTVGAVQGPGQKLNIMERNASNKLKWATPEMQDKYYTDELIAKGYDGVKMESPNGEGNWYKVFEPNKSLSKIDPLIQEAKKYKSAEDVYDALGFTEGAKETIIPIKYKENVVGGIDASVKRGSPDTLLVHYVRILPEAQGKGIGTEAVAKLFKDNPKIKTLIGHATAESKSFWQKQGATFSGSENNIFTIKRSDFQDIWNKAQEVKPVIKKNAEENLVREYLKIKPLAEQTQKEINTIAQKYIDKNGGQLADPGIKKQDSWIRKVKNDYRGDYTKMTDTARNSIISNKPATVFKNIIETEKNVVKSSFKTFEDDVLGFQGGNIKIKGSNGVVGEIQTVSPEMIFAKETKESAFAALGKKLYNSLVDKFGDIGGQGHKIYEEWRLLDPTTDEAEKLAKKSKEYYKQFLGL